jgi:hypothetical protein
MSLTVPPEKVQLTNRQASRILSLPSSLRDVSSFLGRIISHKTAFDLAPLHYRNLQLQFCSLLKSNVPWDAIVHLNDSSLSDVSWWSSCPTALPPHSLLPFQSDITLHSDASNSGWGGVLSSGASTSGSWSTSEKKYHINYLELKAVYLCISSFLAELTNSSLHIFSDNMTTVFYINKVGGTQSSDLCLLALDLWRLIDVNNVKCFASHVPGILNTVADAHSRSEGDRHDYYISEKTFSSILSALPFTPSIDLFASRLTFKLPSYASRLPDPSASIVDAFSMSWGNNLYIFPPLPLLPRVVQKVKSDKAKNVLLISPAWPGLISLPVIMSLDF